MTLGTHNLCVILDSMNKAIDSIVSQRCNKKPRSCCYHPKLQQGNMSGLVSGEILILPFLSFSLALFFFFFKKQAIIFLATRSNNGLMLLSGVSLLPYPKEK